MYSGWDIIQMLICENDAPIINKDFKSGTTNESKSKKMNGN